jgi:hypothetical protein
MKKYSLISDYLVPKIREIEFIIPDSRETFLLASFRTHIIVKTEETA